MDLKRDINIYKGWGEGVEWCQESKVIRRRQNDEGWLEMAELTVLTIE